MVSTKPRQRRIIIATRNGRAYFEFATLLKRLKLAHYAALPDREFDSDEVLLTTRGELADLHPGSYLLYEELRGDETEDAFLLISRLFDDREDRLVLGVDPGGITGVACIYRGFPLAFRSFADTQSAVSYLRRLLKLGAVSKVVRIGDGDRRGLQMALTVSALGEGRTSVEIVDESGTSRRRYTNAPHSQKDVMSAFAIARRRGIVLSDSVIASRLR
jgi:hypothetical protein